MYSWLNIWILPGIWSFCLVAAMWCFNHFWTALYSFSSIWCQKFCRRRPALTSNKKIVRRGCLVTKKQEELNNQIKQKKQIFGMDKMQYSSLQCCLSFEEDFFLLGRNACLINKNKFKYSQVTLTPKQCGQNFEKVAKVKCIFNSFKEKLYFRVLARQCLLKILLFCNWWWRTQAIAVLCSLENVWLFLTYNKDGRFSVVNWLYLLIEFKLNKVLFL